MTDGDRYPWRFGLFLAMYYATNAVYQSFISVYFADKGLSSAEIGILMSAVPIVSLLAQPAWGNIADHAKSRNRVLRLLCALSAGAILLLSLSNEFWVLILVLSLFAACYTSIQPMGDSVILESIQASGHNFGPIRLMGCYAFAVTSIAAGWLIGGDSNRVLYLTSGMALLTLLSTFALPKAVGHAAKRDDASIRELFRDKTLMRLIALVTLLQTTLGYFYVFFSVHFTRLPGGSSALLGWAYLISSTSETIFLLTCDKLFKKLGAGRLLVIAAATLSLRWLILSLTTNVWVVMASQLLHGWGFIVITVSMSKYISLTVPKALRARGQMLLAVSGFGVARVVGNLGGGLIADAIGYQATFGIMAAVAFAAMIALGPKYLKIAPLNGEETN